MTLTHSSSVAKIIKAPTPHWSEMAAFTRAENEYLVDENYGMKKPNRESPKAVSKEKKSNGAGKQEALPVGVVKEDFVGYMPQHAFIYIPTGSMWPAASVNARIGPIPLTHANGKPVLDKNGNPKFVPASAWIDKNKPVEMMTWAPGKPMLIRDKLVSNGGWIDRLGVTTFNLYVPPSHLKGEAQKAGRWLDHVERVYPNDAGHIIRWLACKVQNPAIKINHNIFLGGEQGIGKDTILEPIKWAVGYWNFNEVGPKEICDRFNPHVKSVILRINEIRDLGDSNRFEFYEHTKTISALPPDVLVVNEKHIRPYPVFNVCGVIITSNHKTNGIYLPHDDRGHYIAWSDAKKEDFPDQYWKALWHWYQNENGFVHVAAYLGTLDIANFDPNEEPKKTAAFWEIGQHSQH